MVKPKKVQESIALALRTNLVIDDEKAPGATLAGWLLFEMAQQTILDFNIANMMTDCRQLTLTRLTFRHLDIHMVGNVDTLTI